MSPEQAAGRLDELGSTSDVYSLGATLYVMLTDQNPFGGETEQILGTFNAAGFPAPAQSSPRYPGPRGDLPAGDGPQSAQTLRQRSGSGQGHRAYLAGDAVLAWSEPWLDRLRRWVRRNRGIVAGGVPHLLRY